MRQSRVESIIESLLNVGSGFILSLLIWIYIVIPIWEIEVTMYDNLVITGIYTVSAIARGYLWRRFFNAQIHKKIKSWRG